MKDFIRKFMDKFLCLHDWEEFSTVRVSDSFLGGNWSVYHFKCRKCGKFKRIKSS